MSSIPSCKERGYIQSEASMNEYKNLCQSTKHRRMKSVLVAHHMNCITVLFFLFICAWLKFFANVLFVNRSVFMLLVSNLDLWRLTAAIS